MRWLTRESARGRMTSTARQMPPPITVEGTVNLIGV
jgi:hypothetical protein